MTVLTAPASSLTDGVVQLRLPSPDAGDVTTINTYVEKKELDGGWLPDVPLVTGERLVEDWLNGWAGIRRRRRRGRARRRSLRRVLRDGSRLARTRPGKPGHPAGGAVGGPSAQRALRRSADRPGRAGRRK